MGVIAIAFGLPIAATYAIDRLLKRRMSTFVRGIFVLGVGWLLMKPVTYLLIWILCREGCDL